MRIIVTELDRANVRKWAASLVRQRAPLAPRKVRALWAQQLENEWWAAFRRKEEEKENANRNV